MIVAKNLVKRFGNIYALKGITTEIPEGTTLILGPNGGGKSTFLKLATGIYRPTKGKIRVLGENPWKSKKIKKYIGASYDPPSFPKLITGREWLMFFASAKGYGEEEVERVAKLFKIDFLDKRIGGYSSGMLKKLSVAQAFIGEPKLIFLDEPLANLDFKNIAGFIKIMRKIKQNNESNFVIISHIWEPLLFLADWILVIADGEIVLEGDVQEVQEDVKSLFKVDVDINEEQDEHA
ncbi:ABC transporter ATP-binding protein [Pyrococcus furiosus DSM 3638]|uniref:ABC transporter (ATP-binding protein) n=3 Tax=Pyrococcus furiosus TaxID=2261 RepID=Q8U2F5_PYRFU|nr:MULTISPECIES: ABC transporter ATP-binding protein [Pyrococcus]AAL81005.1 putative ABC transporter (ATP-binding protein) [Pyrococcus furiosus DSM 3638]AFN03670.1 ABC transporter [Pyrococcus furiosus COM1]MDK2869789.1 type transport system ATP-binding protein [Pyrococcus sp.]QEK78551.1 ABC transporter ATP-binding protein [Pyrococcus furiosus DSM 3638]